MGKKKNILIILGVLIIANILFFTLLKKPIQQLGQPFQIEDINTISPDIVKISSNNEAEIVMSSEDKGRFVGINIPIIPNKEVKNIRANMQCSIPGAVLFEKVKEDSETNKYNFTSFPYIESDFDLYGYLSFVSTGPDGRGAMLNSGTISENELLPGTEILTLYKDKEGATLEIDFHFRGEQPEKVTCIITLTSKEPQYATTKKFSLNYPGIKGFKVNREN
ncbi:MAG: hypothetical protein AABX65_01455 [Nanoarchaeota archaeon]